MPGFPVCSRMRNMLLPLYSSNRAGCFYECRGYEENHFLESMSRVPGIVHFSGAMRVGDENTVQGGAQPCFQRLAQGIENLHEALLGPCFIVLAEGLMENMQRVREDESRFVSEWSKRSHRLQERIIEVFTNKVDLFIH